MEQCPGPSATTRDQAGRPDRFLPFLLPILLLALAGCSAPIGADRVTTRQAYAQVEANALRTGKPSAETRSILHRLDLDALADRQPQEAVRLLHHKALLTGERSLLFALAELSFVAAEDARESSRHKPQCDPRDFYLGAAAYSWLFLFGDASAPRPSAFDRRFRTACDLYNYALGLALTQDPRDDTGLVQLRDGPRRLPVGTISLTLDSTRLPQPLSSFGQFLLADRFRIRGFSIRNREPGLGAPLICTLPLNQEFGMQPAAPATAFLHGPSSLAQLESGTGSFTLELIPSLAPASVPIGDESVPVESDLTTFRAHTLNQEKIWKLGKLQFLAPAGKIRNQLLLSQPYDSSRIPVVFVHGTFSSPVTWAELGNTLSADPALRSRYQIWSFMYGSGNPIIYSIADLRSNLTAKVMELDPAGTNSALRNMVVIGHSQGGLLTRSTAINTGDHIWQRFSTNRLEDLPLEESQRAELRRLLFLEPLPFVKRTVFIATPHRGSYLSVGIARSLARRLVALPGNLASRSADFLRLTDGSAFQGFARGKVPTSLDGMSPKNPALRAFAELPVPADIPAHSIIPIEGEDLPPAGRDGVVAYSSARLDGVESELIVRSKHSCLNEPATIEEVRRILLLHVHQLDRNR